MDPRYRYSKGCIKRTHLIPIHTFDYRNDYITFLTPHDYLRLLVLQMYYFKEIGRYDVIMVLGERLNKIGSYSWDVLQKGDYPEWFYQKFEQDELDGVCQYNICFLCSVFERYGFQTIVDKFGYKGSLSGLKSKYYKNVK